MDCGDRSGGPGSSEALNGFVALDLEKGITLLSDDPHGKTFPSFELG